MAGSESAAIRHKPTLHVEVRIRNDATMGFVRMDLVREEVSEWLPTEFTVLQVNQKITAYESLTHRASIESINIVDFSGDDTDSSFHNIEDVALDVQAYELHSNGDFSPLLSQDDPENREDDAPQMHVMRLPNKSLDGAWESLIFEKPIHSRLLRYATRMVLMSKGQSLNMMLVNWNRALLLHGPPGSGKSTLCRALAQKLIIRVGGYFTNGKLVEIDPKSLLSKWFGESGKLVNRIFDQIQSMADDETLLICVLIDEVETITAARQTSPSGNDVRDAMRATNQLLTELDRLRHRQNVIVLCTSNLLSAIDAAFLDRIDVKQFIPNPEPRAIYEILRSCFNELLRCKLLISSEDANTTSEPDTVNDNSTLSPDFIPIEQEIVPLFGEMELHLRRCPGNPGAKMWRIAQKCQGMSGRALRRLPFLALAMHTARSPVSIHEGLAALELAVDDQASCSTTDDTLHL